MRIDPGLRPVLAALVLLTAACGDQPQLLAPPAEPSLAAGPKDGFRVVRVKPDFRKPAGTPGPVVGNFPDAIANVAPGGRIEVEAGTYVVEDVRVDKPVTIEPVEGARPLIRNESGQYSLFVEGVPSGTVTLRGLAFETVSTARSDGIVGAYGEYDQVVIEESTFRASGEGERGVFAGASTVPGARVTVRGSTFEGGHLGVFAANARMDVSGSEFAEHTFSGIQYQQGASGRIEGNTSERCGPFGCIRVHQPAGVEVIGNRVSNEHGRQVDFGIRAWNGGRVVIRDNDVVGTGGSGREEADHAFKVGIVAQGLEEAVVADNRVAGGNRGIDFWGVARGSIRDNLVDPCGAWSCVAVEGGEEIVVAGNTLRSHLDRRTFFAILAAWPHDAGRLAITDNRIEGVGAPADPADQASYPLQIAFQAGAWYPEDQTEGALPQPRGVPVEFSRNRVVNAEVGVRAFHGGVVYGTDNRFDTLWGEALGAHDYGVNRIQRSDFVNYRQAFATSAGGEMEVTCNWWGTAEGPQGEWMPSGVTFAPWATGPIANGAGGACDGGI